MATSDQGGIRPDAGPPGGSGPLAGPDGVIGGPIDDPAMADRVNPRWDDAGGPRPDAQSLANPDGTPNVMPAAHVVLPRPDATAQAIGTTQDQAARALDPDLGRDNIREGRGGGAPNPALAEGGEGG